MNRRGDASSYRGKGDARRLAEKKKQPPGNLGSLRRGARGSSRSPFTKGGAQVMISVSTGTLERGRRNKGGCKKREGPWRPGRKVSSLDRGGLWRYGTPSRREEVDGRGILVRPLKRKKQSDAILIEKRPDQRKELFSWRGKP